MITRSNLSKIGIGSWGIGGFAEADQISNEQELVSSIAYQLSKGTNFVTSNLWNAQGKSAEIISKAIKESDIQRKELFLLQSIYHYNNPTLDDCKREIDKFLHVFEIDTIDSVQVLLPMIKIYGFDKLLNFLNNYLDQGIIRYVSASNFNLEYLKKFKDSFGDKLFSHELHYSFEIRDNADLGIIKYGIDQNIINVPYQPLRRNRTAMMKWRILEQLAQKYGKRTNQIIIRWMTSRGMHPIIKSTTITHIDENLSATLFQMEEADLLTLDNFRPPHYLPKKIDWWLEGTDPKLSAYMGLLPNLFDEEYKNLI